jgi:hypothetical protein
MTAWQRHLQVRESIRRCCVERSSPPFLGQGGAAVGAHDLFEILALIDELNVFRHRHRHFLSVGYESL